GVSPSALATPASARRQPRPSAGEAHRTARRPRQRALAPACGLGPSLLGGTLSAGAGAGVSRRQRASAGLWPLSAAGSVGGNGSGTSRQASPALANERSVLRMQNGQNHPTWNTPLLPSRLAGAVSGRSERWR